MRTLFFLLLLANLTLFAFTRLDTVGAGEGVRLSEQVNAEKIRLLTPQQVAALGPEKQAALADICAEWGPFGETERVRAQTDLEPFALGKLLSTRRIDNGGTLAYLPAASRSAAERRAAQLKASGVREAAAIEASPQRFVVALGTFRSEDAARAVLTDLARQGVTGGQVGPRPASLPMTMLVVRDPPAPVVARLKELQAAYPGAEIRLGTCERSS